MSRSNDEGITYGPQHTEPGLQSKVTRGAAWSGFSSIILRMGSLTVGIVLARILTPEQFGVFAVTLTVQSIIMTVADLGLSSELIRADNPDEIAPTIATLGLITGSVTTAITIATSSLLATIMESPQAAPAIAVLSGTLFLAGASIVPYAFMFRRFQQKEFFIIGICDFVVYTIVTLILVSAGLGVLGLAIGRVVAQVIASTMQFVFAGIRPRYGIDRSVLRPILAYSIPIASANLVAWLMLNVDNAIIARVAGVTALGYYALAFNIASWPMNALSQVVRSISLPYFSRLENPTEALARFVAFGWAVAFPACGILAILSGPVVDVLYGHRWLPAAPVLAALGIYGALRVVFDISTGFLYARQRSKPVLWIQVIWIVTLAMGMIAVIPHHGIRGAAWVHVVVAVLIIFPLYLKAISSSAVSLRALVSRAIWPTLASLPALATAACIRWLIENSFASLVVGGGGATFVYLLTMQRWIRAEIRSMRQ